MSNGPQKVTDPIFVNPPLEGLLNHAKLLANGLYFLSALPRRLIFMDAASLLAVGSFLPYSGAFALAVVFGSCFAYSWSFLLTVSSFLLTAGASLLAVECV